MKQLYYVIRTLLRGRGSNIIKGFIYLITQV